jgi:hypothetical protein
MSLLDNMAFSGDFIRFRKHTGGLNQEELQALSNDAVKEMEVKLLGFEKWQGSLKNYPLKRSDAEALTFRAIEQDVIPGARFSAFHKLFFQKENEDNVARYEDNLGGFHGAVTQLLKKNSLLGSGEKHGALESLLNEAKDEITEYRMIRNAA